MIIQGDDFKLEGELGRFDLYLMKVINAKDAEKRREELALHGYDMYFDTCLNVIINYKINKKQEVYTFAEYLKQYRKERLALSKITE